MKKKMLLISFILVVAIVGIYLFLPADSPSSELTCETDVDCVPAQCCHPTSCINEKYAPDCSGVSCTLECQPNTLDCNQGYCACINGQCTAVFSDGLV